MSKVSLLGGVSVFVAIGLLVPMSGARAQDTEPAEAVPAATAEADGDAGEIIVTARRREEALVDVPASVTVVGRELLEKAQVDTLLDIGTLVPNLNVTNQARQGITLVQLRGLNTVQGGESPVTVLIDGVQNPSLDFFSQDIGDIESVQVLGGPQGAVYGRGAIGGAILINTRQPTNEFEGSVTARYGRGDTYRAAGAVSGPIKEDMVYFRLQAAATGTDGLIENSFTGKGTDFSRRGSYRGQLLFDLGDTRIDLRGSYTRARDAAAVLEMATNQNQYDFSFGPSNDQPVVERSRRGQFSLKLDQDVGLGTLTSISQYAFTKSIFTGDTDFISQDIARQFNDNPVKAFNQDLRLASPEDQAVRWMVGGFYQWRRTINEVLVTAGNQHPAVPAGTELFHARQRDRSIALAGYGQVAADLTDATELAVALRYDVEKRRGVDELVANSETNNTFKLLQPQATLRHKLSPRSSVYASIGRGFRSGGLNSLQDAITAGVPRLFEAEKSLNYEVGAKVGAGRFNASAAAFYTELDDQQIFLITLNQDSSGLARALINVPKTRIIGLDLAASYRLSSALTLSGALGINDSVIRSAPFKGNKSPQIQSYNFNVALDYDGELTERIDGFARIAYSGHGRVQWDIQNSISARPAQYLMARAGIRLNENLELAVYGDNLTNEREPAYLATNTFGPGVHARFQNQPRSYGLEAKLRF